MTGGYVGRLRRRQLSEGWTDKHMADELGISPALWHLLVGGEREPGMSFVRRAMRRFPEYNLELMTLMADDGPLGEGSGHAAVS